MPKGLASCWPTRRRGSRGKWLPHPSRCRRVGGRTLPTKGRDLDLLIASYRHGILGFFCGTFLHSVLVSGLIIFREGLCMRSLPPSCCVWAFPYVCGSIFLSHLVDEPPLEPEEAIFCGRSAAFPFKIGKRICSLGGCHRLLPQGRIDWILSCLKWRAEKKASQYHLRWVACSTHNYICGCLQSFAIGRYQFSSHFLRYAMLFGYVVSE